MIRELKPVSLAEVKDLVKNLEEKKNLDDFVKKFARIDVEKSLKMKEELDGLKSLKMKEEYLIKIIDFLPKDAEELNRIFNDISLDEKETNEILEIVKKY